MKSAQFYRIVVFSTVLGLTSFGGTRASATPPDSAEMYFQQGEYQEALNIWYDQAASGIPSADLYYNIGIAESMLRHTPNAIFAYEQALRLKPMNKEMNGALAEERKKIQEAVIPVNPFFLQKWYEAFLSFLRPGYWAMAGLCLLCLLTLNLLGEFQVLFQKPFLHGKLKWSTGVLAILTLVLAGMAYKEIYRADEAIVYSACGFRQAPSEDSPEIRNLYPGEKTFIKDQIGDWLHVKLLNQDAGWIRKDCLKTIRVSRG
jgi:tetratricopeptide (TPR) repeat protein